MLRQRTLTTRSLWHAWRRSSWSTLVRGAAPAPRKPASTLIVDAVLVDGSGRRAASGRGPPARRPRRGGRATRARPPARPSWTHAASSSLPASSTPTATAIAGCSSTVMPLAAVSQGITTIVAGQDGGSPWPLSDFFARLQREPAAVNVAAYAGHGRIRHEVMGGDFRRAATPEELGRMRVLLERELGAGALGLSTGLEYDPGIYSAPSEVIELARVAAAAGGRYISHVRSEDRHFWGSDRRDRHHRTRGRAARPGLAREARDAQPLGTDGPAAAHAGRGTGPRHRRHRGRLPVPLLAVHADRAFPERDFENRAAAEFAVREVSTLGRPPARPVRAAALLRRPDAGRDRAPPRHRSAGHPHGSHPRGPGLRGRRRAPTTSRA